MQGGSETTLAGTAALTATTHRQAWARPPIDVDFQVLMFTASGLLVRFLKVFEKKQLSECQVGALSDEGEREFTRSGCVLQYSRVNHASDESAVLTYIS